MSTIKKIVKKTTPKKVAVKPAAKKPVAKKMTVKKVAPKAKTTSTKVAVKKSVVKPVVSKTAAKKIPVKKAMPTKVVAKKTAVKQAARSKIMSKKPLAKQAAPSKTVLKKASLNKASLNKATASSKVVAKKPAVKQAAPSKVVAKKIVPVKVKAEEKAAPQKTHATKPGMVKKVASKPVSLIQTSINLVTTTPSPSKPKQVEPVKTHTTLKTNLAELMPEYEAPEEEIKQDYMNEKHKERFYKLLNDWKYQLMAEVDRTVEHMKDDTGNFADPADRASQEEGFNLELRARDRERNLIKKIEEAIKRLENGEYGYCEACGVEIGYKRLEARPTATLCIDCKTVDEIRERQLAS
jgi:DnaK suppressor protein